jgi:hypothetical protein
VQTGVFRLGHQDKVLQTVVCLVLVPVVNTFVRRYLPTYRLFHQKHMKCDHLSAVRMRMCCGIHPHIAVPVYRSDAVRPYDPRPQLATPFRHPFRVGRA